MPKSVTSIILPIILIIWLIGWTGNVPQQAVAASGEELLSPLSIEAAVARAITSNREVKAAIEASRSAEAAYRSARADRFAKAAAEYSYTHFKDQPYMWVEAYQVSSAGLITGLESYRKPVSDRDQVQWNVTLTQPLFTGFALSTRVRMAELGIRSRQVEEAIAIQDVVKKTKLAFVDVLLAEKMLLVAAEAETSIAAHARNAEHFYDQGMIPYNDKLQASVALADAIQRRASMAQRQAMAVAALNVVLDLPVNRETVLVELAGPPADIAADLDSLMADAIRGRAELESLALARQQLAQGIVLARSSRYPTIALFGQYRQRGEDLAATDNDYDNPYNTLVGIQAQWTFFEWGKTQAETARLRHDMNGLDEKIGSVTQAIQLEVKDAFSRLQVARENIRTAEAALNQASENLRIVNTRYAQQMATSTDVLDANAKQTQARANYFGAVYGCHSALAELVRAVGRPLTADSTGNGPHS